VRGSKRGLRQAPYSAVMGRRVTAAKQADFGAIVRWSSVC